MLHKLDSTLHKSRILLLLFSLYLHIGEKKMSEDFCIGNVIISNLIPALTLRQSELHLSMSTEIRF